MMWWQVVAAANGVVAVVYLAIAHAIVRPLVRTGQLRENRLGAATAAIFFTCAVHHGSHTVHMLLPAFSSDTSHDHMRTAFDLWQIAVWDVITAAVGVYYWSLRRAYGPLLHGAKLFEDMKDRQRQALAINDTIVQGLTVAQMALVLDDRATSQEALERSLASARTIITELLGEVGETTGVLRPGDAVRHDAADLKTALDEPEDGPPDPGSMPRGHDG